MGISSPDKGSTPKYRLKRRFNAFDKCLLSFNIHHLVGIYEHTKPTTHAVLRPEYFTR